MPSADVELENQSRRIRENILDGTYNLVMHGLKTCKGNHWNTIRCVVDEEGERIKNTYACSVTNCSAVFISNLSTEGTGKLSRHHKKCNRNTENVNNTIDSYFDKEFTTPSAKRIKKEHKSIINDAAVSFVVNDLRPVEAVTKPGLVTLLAVFTQIGAAYGKMNSADVLRILPSRFSVSFQHRFRVFMFVNFGSKITFTV